VDVNEVKRVFAVRCTTGVFRLINVRCIFYIVAAFLCMTSSIIAN
jgi:hypothetical protein